MILTNKQIEEIINTYAKENNIDTEKYELNYVVNWYNWWWKQTLVWKRPVTDYTYEENKEEIIGYIKSKIHEHDWEEKYGYKGNYDGCRKICSHCKHSCHRYQNKITSETRTMFCIKMSEKYKIPIEIYESSDICKGFCSIFEVDKDLNLEEYFDWLSKAWYVNHKGETTIQNKTRSIVINKIHFGIPYLKFKELDIIKDGVIQNNSYYGGKWSKNKGYSISGKDNVPINTILNK